MKITSGHWFDKNNKKMDLSNLHCPECDSIYLHQRTIGIYNCDEDASTGVHLDVQSKSFTMDTNLTGNPSPRRQGLSISFYCENCDDINPSNGIDHPGHILNIFQHKGETYIGWEGK